jgi:hypothetical protein
MFSQGQVGEVQVQYWTDGCHQIHIPISPDRGAAAGWYGGTILITQSELVAVLIWLQGQEKLRANGSH